MIRWIIVVVAIVLFATAALWAVNNYIRKDDYAVVRDAVEQRVSEVFGKEFRIHGEVGMTTSLSPTIRFNDLRLANANWARDEYLATAQRFEVQLRLIPLLFGNYSIANTEFDGLDVNLEISENGVTNWQFGTETDDEPEEFEAVFNEINAENFDLNFFDHRDENELSVILDSFSLHTDNSSDPIEIETNGTYNGVRARLSGEIGSWNSLLSGTGSEMDLRAEYKDINMAIKGNLSGPEPDGFRPGDLHITATGIDVMTFADFYEFELFSTDKFSIDGHLLGTRAALSASNTTVYMEARGNTLEIKGDAPDLLGLTEFDIQAHATGSNLSEHYGDLIEIDLPESDDYDAKGRIRRADGITSLSDMFLDATEGPAHITAKGGIANIEELLGFDVDYEVTGNNVEILEPFSGIDLPPTDRFLLAGHLLGAASALRADALRFEVDVEELALKANGSVENLVDGNGFDLLARAEGNDLGDVDALLRPFSDLSLRDTILHNPDLDENVTGTFVITGHVTGSQEALRLDDVDGRATRDNNLITLNGSVGDLFGLENIDLRFSAEGPNLAELNIVLPRELPTTGRYKLSGHLTGTTPDVVITELSGELTKKGHVIRVNGTVGEVMTRKGQNLTLSMSGGNIRDLETYVAVRFPATDRYKASLNSIESNGRLNLKRISFDGSRDSIEADIRGEINDVLGTPTFDISMEASGEEFGDGGEYFDMEFPREGPFVFGGTIEGNAKRIVIKEVHGKVGDSSYRGKAIIEPGDRLKIIDAHLTGHFDATPWIPETEEVQEKRQARGRLFSEREFDYSILRKFDMDLEFDQLRLTQGSALITVNNGKIRVKDGILRADPFDGQYQQAKIDLALEIDASQAEPKFSITMLSEGFDLGTFLDQTDRQDGIRGTVDFNIEAAGVGTSMAKVASSSNGDAMILFTQGFFPEQNLPLKITDFIFASFKWLGGKQDLLVECAMSYATLESGTLEQEILYVDSNQMVMGGYGNIDLGKEKFDLTIAPRPKKRRFLSTDLDVDVKGSLLDPKFSLNTASAATSGAKHYGAFLALGPAGFLLPMSTGARGMSCVNSITEFQDHVQAAENQ